jgi:transcriptional regulator with GAF, ATPase, and Fis domain/tetratricopeptide (TPR) repeat protein
VVAREKPLLEGSKRNLAALLELHDELSGGGGGVAVLGGARGVGKALLLGELRRELSARGRLVLFGRAEQAATHPFAALREPAAQALAFLEARGVAEEFLDSHARALAVLLPSLQASPTARARDKTGFLEALRAFFIEIGRFGPLTMLLSDLHYADDDTREALRFLAQHLFNPDVQSGSAEELGEAFNGVLMVGSRTDDEDGAAFARSLTAGRRARLFEVGGLSRAQLLEYLASHPLLERLLGASRGRPEDVDELLESLPRDTDALLLQRTSALEPVARGALHALAVLGRPAPPDLLAAVVGAPAGEVAQALAQLVEGRLLARRLQNGELLFTFARPHHGEVLKEHLAADERAKLHHAVAATLEQRGGDLSEPLLAFHFLRGSQPQRAVPWVLAACEKLLLTFAYGTLVDLVSRTLPVASADERFALLGHLVEAQRLRGDLRAALASAEEMRELATQKQLPTVLRRIGELLSARGDHRAALEVLEEVKELVDGAGAAGGAGNGEAGGEAGGEGGNGDDHEALPERALVFAAMAEVAYTKNNLESAQENADAALAAAPAAPMAFKLRCSNTLGKVAYSRDRFDEAEATFLANLRHAEEHGLEHEAILARVNTGLARHRRGHNDEAREMLERALTTARAAGDLHSESNALLNLGAIEQRGGELGKSLERYKAAWARFSRLGDRNAVRRVTWNLANLTCALGHYSASQTWLEHSRHLAEADDSERGRGFVHFTEGDLAYNQGQPGAALASYEKAREVFLRIGETSRVVEMTAKAAWAALLLGDVGHAELRVSELPESPPGSLAHARKAAVEGALLLMNGEGPRTAGDGTPLADDDDARGLSLLSTAIDELDRLRAHDDAWRTLAFLADRFEGRGDNKSAEAARARARAFVERAAARLPEDLKQIMLGDPQRAALFGAPPHAAEAGAPLEAAVADVIDRAGLAAAFAAERAPAPVSRKPEWDARYPELVGRAPTLLRVFDRLDRIARSRNATVLIRGESGTGKELVAAAVHRLSERMSGPFVRVNCAALVETLLMSELFGHEKGSFTGALARKIGRFELARGGTIFLDEIGDISPKTQVSLLRVLQERQFERVGGTQTISTDAVVICATHRDLESMVRDGSFREDLYYRLRGVVVEMPALRERAEDIPLLAQRFLQKTRDEVGRAPVALSPDAEQVLIGHRWPGNIRELQNVIRSVALFCEGEVVEVEHLAEFPELFTAQELAPRAAPSPPRPSSTPTLPPVPLERAPLPPVTEDSRPTPTRDVLGRVAAAADEGIALGDLKRRLEFEAIANAMRQTGGNITRAAALLRMKRPRLSQIVNGNPDLKAIKEASRESEVED